MVTFNIIKTEILDKLFSRRFFMIALCFECLIKNVSLIKCGKVAIYVICAYAFLFLLYKLFFDHKFLFRKNMILQYLFLVSAIIPCLIYKFIGLYNDIVLLTIFAVMFLIVSNFDDNEDEKEVQDEFLFINRLICIMYFVYSLISLIVALLFGTDRVYGLIDKVDYYSYNCVTALGCALYVYLIDKSKINKYISFASIILHLVILFFTFARATYLGLFIAIILSVFAFAKKNEYSIMKYLNIKFIVAAGFLLIVFFAFSVQFLPFSFELLIEKIFKTGLSGRKEIWEFGFVEFIKYNKLFGLSYGGLPIVWGKDVIPLKDSFMSYIISYDFFKYMIENGMGHSIYLEQLFTHGIFGLVLLMLFTVRIIYNYAKILKHIDKQSKFFKAFIISCSFTVIAQLVIGIFNTNIFFNIVYISQVFFFYYVGMLRYQIKKLSN